MAGRGINEKRREFARQLIATGNAAEAYRRVYPDKKYTTKQECAKEAFKLKNTPEVAAILAEMEQERNQQHQVTIKRIVEEYSKLAFLDARKAFDENGNLRPLNELDDATAAAVAGIEVGDDRKIRKLRLSDKIRALDSLGKYLGMFVERVEHSGPGGGPIEISAAEEAALEERLQAMAKGGTEPA